MLWNAVAGKTVGFSRKTALADYSTVTGYDPSDPDTDQGTDMRVAMNWRRKTGVIDTSGVRHKIGAYVALEPGNWDELCEALYAFSAVAIGFEVPSYAMDQFNAGQPWSYKGRGQIEGGHYVPCVGRPGKSRIRVVTWGQLQDMTRSFYEHFNDETYAVLSPEVLGAGGKTPEGLDIDALNAALAAL
jgi:hypothetical protein